MINSLLGTKQKMGATYVSDTRVPVTWVKVGPCVVTQIKKTDKDGYFAVQLGFGEKRAKNTSKPLQGHLRKTQDSPLHQGSEGQVKLKTQNKKLEEQAKLKTQEKFPRYLKEIRLEKESDLKVGDTVNLSDIFKKGDQVSVTGTSKGKGFAGVVKRYRFAGGPKTHGQSDRERAPGSIGQRTTPGRVWKGKRMAGRMGQDTITIKNLIVADTDEKEGLIAVSGGLPGSVGSLLVVKKTGSGKLKELIEETPVTQIVQGDEPEETSESGEISEGNEKSNNMKPSEAKTTDGKE